MNDFDPNTFDIQGHRGARGLKPENTLPAFETALDLLVTTLELDLHLTADGVVVVWHDPKIEAAKCRLDPEASVEAPDPDSLIFQGEALLISRLTFDQLQAYTCDRNPDRGDFPDQDSATAPLAGDDYGIVSLAELLDFVEVYSRSPEKTEVQRANAAQVHFNVETKRRPDHPEYINDGFDGRTAGPFERGILDLVVARGLTARFIIQSFDHRSLWAVRAETEDIRLAALTAGGEPTPAAYAEKGAAIWSPSHRDLTSDRMAEAHSAGLLVIPWTVNDTETMRALIEQGVDGLISDRPDLLRILVDSLRP
ncbi:MAG TPA: glycerophosphodiester phosphodiesterase family protein [Anaerolineales bacterium]|nr:glycerophosphodiester phosphodiesterase family protein [Anaerolineales bacterium]